VLGSDPGLIIEGLTTATTLPNVAVFMPNGSVLDSGAIRIGDKDSNYCEVRIEPEATAKVAVLRWHAEAATPGFYP
jgi:hypothetical protein